VPVIRYHCSKCDREFELMRPPNKAGDNMNCPKCGHPSTPSSNFLGRSQSGQPESVPEPGLRKEVPRWVKGQVESQIRQMVSGNDSVAGQEVELIAQKVLKDLNDAGLEATPGNIKTLAQRHLAGFDSWAKIARRSGAKMDEAAKDEED